MPTFQLLSAVSLNLGVAQNDVLWKGLNVIMDLALCYPTELSCTLVNGSNSDCKTRT